MAARDSNWADNEGVELAGWSSLAMSIVSDLSHDREISDVFVRSHFDLTATLPYLKPAPTNIQIGPC